MSEEAFNDKPMQTLSLQHSGKLESILGHQRIESSIAVVWNPALSPNF